MIKIMFWVNTVDFPISGALWYLTAAFFASMIYFCLNKWVSNDTILTMLTLVVSVFGFMLPYICNVPFAIGPALIGVLLMHIGNILNGVWVKLSNLLENRIAFMAAVIVFFVMALSNSYVDMRLGKYGNRILFIIAAVTASVIIAYMCQKIEKCDRLLHVKAFISFMGKNSIVFLCLNQLAIVGVKAVLAPMLYENGILSKGFGYILVYVSVFGILYGIGYLSNIDFHIGMLFGKS